MASDETQPPRGWAETTLAAVCQILDSRRIPVNKSERSRRIEGRDEDELYPYYGATGKVGEIDDFIFEGEHVLVGEDGAPFLDFSKSKAYLVRGKFWVNNHAHIIKSSVSNAFVCHYLNYIDYSVHVTGTTRLKLTQDALRQLPLRVAPANEQIRIVAKIEELFSELDKGIESLKTARRQLEVYRQAVLKHAFEGKLTAQWRKENKDKLETPEELLARVNEVRAARYEQELQEWERAVKTWEAEGKHGKRPPKPGRFKPQTETPPEEVERFPSISKGWSFVRLCQVAEVGSGMSVSATRKLEDSLKVPYLRVANVQRGFLDLTEVKHMTIEKSQLESLQLEQWDVLFNEGGDRDKLGRGWIWQSEISPCITQNHVFRARPYLASEFNSKLLSFWANTFGKRYFDKAGKQTTNLASINKTVLSQFPVPLIPYAEQEEICSQIDRSLMSLDAQEREIARALGMADLLRQSILNKAFAGQLVAQDPGDEPASVLLEKIRTESAKAGKSGPTARRNRKKTAA